MRHISFRNERPDAAWQAKADQLLVDMTNAADHDARKKIIDDNKEVWGELKAWLLTLSNEKCWFSEAKDCFNHWHVEHFRPKKSAKDANGTSYDVYWWLAFDWHNFRICGNVGNTKKGTFFPLRHGSVRATGPQDDLRYETPYLLDPADEDDPNLLSFNMLGEAIVTPGVVDPWDIERVTYSVEKLKLDFDKLVLKRETVWTDCAQHIKEYLAELAKYSNSNGTNQIAFHESKAKAKAIREMMREDKELSSVARACVLATGDKRVFQLLRTI